MGGLKKVADFSAIIRSKRHRALRGEVNYEAALRAERIIFQASAFDRIIVKHSRASRGKVKGRIRRLVTDEYAAHRADKVKRGVCCACNYK